MNLLFILICVSLVSSYDDSAIMGYIKAKHHKYDSHITDNPCDNFVLRSQLPQCKYHQLHLPEPL